MCQSRKLLPIFILTNFFIINIILSRVDVTVVGPMLYADGIGRISIGFMDCLKKDISMNFIQTSGSQKDVPEHVLKIVNNKDTGPGKITILFDPPWSTISNSFSKISNQSGIRLAYSMIESSAIPRQWVQIFNSKFDAVLVPDQYYVDVYKNSGVKIPIFVFPHGIYLEEFLNSPIKNKKNNPFIFGFSAGLHSDRKNPEMLVDAFCKEFGTNANVRLHIHVRFGDNRLINRLEEKIKNINSHNIKLTTRVLSAQEYLDFLSSLDCFVSFTKGEGYSVTPREALALGISCIITNNTAQSTICKTGFVRSVPSDIKEPAHYLLYGGNIGYHFNCKINDACDAMRDVYENYQIYLDKARNGREWVKQYLYANLYPKYLTLVKPQKIILGSKNLIDNGVITTDSKNLYNKYTKLIKSNKF